MAHPKLYITCPEFILIDLAELILKMDSSKTIIFNRSAFANKIKSYYLVLKSTTYTSNLEH